MRKTVLIPVVSLGQQPKSHLLELIIEPAGPKFGAAPQFHHLRRHGLEVAVAMAEEALRMADLPPPPPLLSHPLKISRHPPGPPNLFLANPLPGLSNAGGAALGVTMGLLMYDGRCPGERMLATGQLRPATSPGGLIDIQPTHCLAEKFAAALILGYQRQPLPFVVPARTEDGTTTKACCAEQIQALARRNICVMPVATLQEAVVACQNLLRHAI